MHTFFDKKNYSSNNNINKGLRPLPEKSVIIMSWSNGNDRNFSQVDNDQKQLLELLPTIADHSMIYADGKLYHSASGHSQRVISHPVTRIIEPNETNPESFIVLSCNDEKLTSSFINMVKRWDTKTPKTPFAIYDSRKKDKEEVSKEHELYRAVRAYWRGNQELLLPLSKNKGVSCTQFLTTAFKAAIIARLFPGGLPKEINEKFCEIEDIKKHSAYTKLQQIDFNYFKDFYSLIEKHINESKLDIPEKLKYLEFLSLPTKGYSVTDFCKNINRFPEIWEFGGYVFLLEKENLKDKNESVYEPYLMDHSTYLAWNKHLSPTKPSRVLTANDLITIQELTEQTHKYEGPK